MFYFMHFYPKTYIKSNFYQLGLFTFSVFCGRGALSRPGGYKDGKIK